MELLPTLQAFVLAAVVAAVATPLARRVAKRTGAVASPNGRSVHTEPIPYLGGLAIFAAFAGTLAFYTDLDPTFSRALLLGSAVIVLAGLWDDLFPMPWWLKLGTQFGAAGVLVAYGITIDFVRHPLSDAYLRLDESIIPLSIILTVIWVVAITNIINFIDGLDGLAAGIVAIATGVLFVAGVQLDVPLLVLIVLAALAGAALGFLPYNFYPARIFMGDAGSMLLGYVLAAVAIQGLFKGATAVVFAVPVIALGVPLVDTMLAVVRRSSNGQAIWAADMDHVHHRLMELGLGHRGTVLVLYAASIIFGVGAITVLNTPLWQGLAILALILVSFYYFGRRFNLLVVRRPAGTQARRRLRRTPPSAPEANGSESQPSDAHPDAAHSQQARREDSVRR